MMKEYDLIIIGSGGATKLIRPCADLGYRVAVVEKERFGGTCLNRGCIPSKMLIHPADVATQISEAHRFSVNVADPVRYDLHGLVERVNATIDAESDGIAPIYEKHPNIDVYRCEARFLSDKVLEVGVGNEVEEISADRIFLPVGARPRVPDLPGLAGTPFWTYVEALRNTKPVKKLTVFGGGYIATELGHFYGSMGVDMHFLLRSSFLRNEDEQVSEEFTRVFTRRFPTHFGVKVTEVRYRDEMFTVSFVQEDGQSAEIDSDALLIATGVVPNADLLRLGNTGIEVDEQGFIKVDDYLQTTVPGVYAFGDVIGRWLFRHTANYEGEYLFRTLYQDHSKQPILYPPVPHAVFSYPQIGAVGKTEQQLKAEGVDYFVGFNRYADSAMGMALMSEHGFVKLLFERGSRKLLGAHIVGEEASNMVHMLIAYMKMNATLDDLLETIYIHPALPEVVRNAARKAKAAKKTRR